MSQGSVFAGVALTFKPTTRCCVSYLKGCCTPNLEIKTSANHGVSVGGAMRLISLTPGKCFQGKSQYQWYFTLNFTAPRLQGVRSKNCGINPSSGRLPFALRIRINGKVH